MADDKFYFSWLVLSWVPFTSDKVTASLTKQDTNYKEGTTTFRPWSPLKGLRPSIQMILLTNSSRTTSVIELQQVCPYVKMGLKSRPCFCKNKVLLGLMMPLQYCCSKSKSPWCNRHSPHEFGFLIIQQPFSTCTWALSSQWKRKHMREWWQSGFHTLLWWQMEQKGNRNRYINNKAHQGLNY